MQSGKAHQVCLRSGENLNGSNGHVAWEKNHGEMGDTGRTKDLDRMKKVYKISIGNASANSVHRVNPVCFSPVLPW
jgi:hypothetical protein